jgi:hypothetical protein
LTSFPHAPLREGESEKYHFYAAAERKKTLVGRPNFVLIQIQPHPAAAVAKEELRNLRAAIGGGSGAERKSLRLPTCEAKTARAAKITHMHSKILPLIKVPA